MTAGRTCPLDYQLPADTFSGQPLFECETLYIVGGLYGNRQALAALEKRLAAEPGARAVFNGDVHWFDAEPAVFADVRQRDHDGNSRIREQTQDFQLVEQE